MTAGEWLRGARARLTDSGDPDAACDAECKRLDSTLAGLKADLDAARTQSATVFGTPP